MKITISGCVILLAFTLLVSGLAAIIADDHPTVAKVNAADEPKGPSPEERLARYRSLFGPISSDKDFLRYLNYIDPQPDRLLSPLGDKLLDPSIIFEATEWMKEFFHDRANPIHCKIAPSKYYLGSDFELSQLVYEWKDKDNAYHATESSKGVLLCVRPIKHPVDFQNGISGEATAEIIDRMIKVQKKEGRRLIDQFRLPIRLAIGTVFSNAGEEYFLRVRGWEEHIVGFISNQDVCLMVYKIHLHQQLGMLPPNKWWLWPNLYEKDGKTRVYKGQIVLPPKDKLGEPGEEKKEEKK